MRFALLLLLVLLASILGRPDIPIDETRYVSVAWEMWSGGNWLDYLVPHKNGLPYHHKPPLLFWLINLGWMVFGVNDWWPRVISALFSLACLPLVVAIAHRIWPHVEGVGGRARWILLGGAYWLFFSTAVVFDVMLAFFALLALYCALCALEGKRLAWWGFGLAVGLGILAKGPVLLLHVLPVLLLAPWWSFHAFQRAAWYRGLALGSVLGVLVALAWAIPAAIFGGEEFRNAIFWGQTAGRVSGSLAHKQPVWFYLATLPVLLFPWFFWGGTWRAVLAALRDRSEGRSGVRFCIAWIVPAVLIFSLSGGKQVHYLIPLLPAFALLVAFGLGRVPVLSRWATLPLVLALGALGGLFLASSLWVNQLWLAPYAGKSWLLGGGLLLALAGLALVWVRGEAVPARMAVLTTLISVVFILFVLRPLSPIFDMVPMAERIQAHQQQGFPVANAAAYNDQFQFYGRLRQPLIEIPRSEITAWLDKNPQGRVVAYLKKPVDAAKLQPEFSQPYLEGAVVMLDAESAKRFASLVAP